MDVARRMWMRFEPLHAVVYFAPEHHKAQDAAGLKGGWMAYFASRAAPLGAVSSEVVAAAFYNFAPAMVARAIPDAWALAPPARVLEARAAGVGQALRRILGELADAPDVAEAAGLLRAAGEACDLAGRPLFAANLALDWPDEPVLELWHGATLLREHRGGGHVAALLAHEVDGCEAHVLAAASGATRAEHLRPYRGWTDEQWEAAVERLRGRGLLGPDGGLSAEGRRLRESVEARTDRLAAHPWERLGPESTARLERLLAPLLDALAASGTIPYPNPMGLPPPGAAASAS